MIRTLVTLLMALVMSGCAAKHKAAPTVYTFVVPKECIDKFEPTGDCKFDKSGKIACPTHMEYHCKKVVPK